MIPPELRKVVREALRPKLRSTNAGRAGIKRGGVGGDAVRVSALTRRS